MASYESLRDLVIRAAPHTTEGGLIRAKDLERQEIMAVFGRPMTPEASSSEDSEATVAFHFDEDACFRRWLAFTHLGFI